MVGYCWRGTILSNLARALLPESAELLILGVSRKWVMGAEADPDRWSIRVSRFTEVHEYLFLWRPTDFSQQHQTARCSS